DASHELTPSGLRRRELPLRRRLKRLTVLHPRLGWPVQLVWNGVRRLRRAVGSQGARPNDK
ncbi:MAG TPA: hypothetical protein VGM56_20080, partial [Byssovorax sp.]